MSSDVADQNQTKTDDSPQAPLTTGAVISNAGSGAKKPILRLLILIAVLVLLLAGGLILYANNKNSKSESSTSKKAEAAKPTLVVLNKKVMTDYGYSITADEKIEGYIAKKPKAGVDIVLFKLNIAQASASQYIGTDPIAPNFVLVVDGKEIHQGDYPTGASAEELDKAGYSKLVTKAVPAGTQNIGYIQFGVPKAAIPTTLRYKQVVVKVMGSQSGTIPAKDYDIPLQ